MADSKCVHSVDFPSVVHRFHVYKDEWEPILTEVLICEIEPDNMYDKHAVAVKKEGRIVGHVPMENSKVFKFFLRRGGHITATLTGNKINRGLAYLWFGNTSQAFVCWHRKGYYSFACTVEAPLISE